MTLMIDSNGDHDDDLEAELMDLESNEHAYLPPQPIVRHSLSGSIRSNSTVSSSSADSSNSNSNSNSAMPAGAHTYQTPSTTPSTQYKRSPPPTAAPTESKLSPQLQQQQMLRAAVNQHAAIQQQARTRFQPTGDHSTNSHRPSMSSLASSFASSLGLRPSLDSHSPDTPAQRQQAALDAITQLRQQQLAAATLQADTAAASIRAHHLPTGDPNVDAMAQMVAKLNAVVASSLDAIADASSSIAMLWTNVLQELPAVEPDFVARSADEQFASQMHATIARKRDVSACIEKHLTAILLPTGQRVAKTVSHSLGRLLQSFRSMFLTCYGAEPFEPTTLAYAVLPLATADVRQFSAILVQLVLFKFDWLVPYSVVVKRSVLALLFDLLQPTLHRLYVDAFAAEDTVMAAIASRKRATPLASYGLPPVFRLDGSWQPKNSDNADSDSKNSDTSLEHALHAYSSAIHRLDALATVRSPWHKVEALALVCRDMDATIKRYYAPFAVPPSPEEININADALRALLAFALVSAPALGSHVFSQLAILSSYLPEPFEAREEGFALATFTAAVQLVARLP